MHLPSSINVFQSLYRLHPLWCNTEIRCDRLFRAHNHRPLFYQNRLPVNYFFNAIGAFLHHYFNYIFLHNPSPAISVSSICFSNESFSKSHTAAMPPCAYFVLVSSFRLGDDDDLLSGKRLAVLSAKVRPAMPIQSPEKSVFSMQRR